jgi:hypothetical protein
VLCGSGGCQEKSTFIAFLEIGGADGIRTHDLLDAIEARSQLRHGPTEKNTTFPVLPGRAPNCATATEERLN